MQPPKGWDEAALLSTLPKDISINLQPADDGLWMADITGVPGVSAYGCTMEDAQAMVLDTLHEIMVARRDLAAARCRQAGRSPAPSPAKAATGD